MRALGLRPVDRHDQFSSLFINVNNLVSDRNRMHGELKDKVNRKIDFFRESIVKFSEIDKPKLFSDMLQLLKDVASYAMLKTEIDDAASVRNIMDHFCSADFAPIFASEYHEDYNDVIKAKDAHSLLELLIEHRDALQEALDNTEIVDQPVGEETLCLSFFKLQLLSAVISKPEKSSRTVAE